MKKTVLVGLLLALTLSLGLFLFAGCSNNEPELVDNPPQAQVPSDEQIVEEIEEPEENPLGLEFYLLDDGTYGVGAGGAAFLSEIEVPATYKDVAVTEVVDGGFEDCQNLKTIILPDSIDYIGRNAFTGCAVLSHVQVSGSWNMIAGNSKVELTGDLDQWIQVIMNNSTYELEKIS